VSLSIAPDLWRKLCAFLAEHDTCQVVLHQHQGRVCKLDLGLVKETIRAGQGDMVHLGEMPVYTAPGSMLTKT